MPFGRGTRSISRQSIARQSTNGIYKTQKNTNELQNQLTKSLTKIIPILEARIAKEIEARIAKEIEARIAKEIEARIAKEIEARIAKEIEAKYKSKIQMLEAEIKKLKTPLESIRYKNRLPTISENN